jgi:hypothetical protein
MDDGTADDEHPPGVWPSLAAEIRQDRDCVLLWVNEKTGSGVMVHLGDPADLCPTIDFHVETKHGLTEAESGLNKWIAAATFHRARRYALFFNGFRLVF